jgi:hypothetical protein
MSDIEKRKELSEEENLENGSAEKEKMDKNPETAEIKSSQSADQGSVTNEEKKSDDETREVSPDAEKSQSDQEASSSLKDSQTNRLDSEEDSSAKIHSGEDIQSKKNAVKESEEDKAPDAEESLVDKSGKDSDEEDGGPTDDIKHPEDKVSVGELKTPKVEIEVVEKESESGEENKEKTENDIKPIHEEVQESVEEAQSSTETSAEKDQPLVDKEEGKDQEGVTSPEASDEEILPSSEAFPDRDESASEASADKDHPSSKIKSDREVKKDKKDKEGVDQVVESHEELEGEEEEDEVEDEVEVVDYSTLNKEGLIHEMEVVLKVDDMKKVERQIRIIKPFYDEIFEHERKESLQKFLDEGGAEVDFEYAGDALDSRFSSIYEKYKARRNNYYANLDKEKDINLQKKHEVLEKLRSLVDGEETTTSIGALKEIQKEWKEIGSVPNQYAKSLWATYNILIDRFYDNRSIYFELKELDRKKNLEGKLELCHRAEELAKSNNIKEAVKELNELHEEFKHIGPVPKEIQEEVWQRFKASSDAIYAKRKEFVGRLKKDLNENLKLKMDLVEAVGQYKDFDSDKISDWNEKTKEILDIQKKWESIGGLPREHAKEINKSFWSNFKLFFNSKNKFFKKLEGQRDENMKLKEELVKKAEALCESEEWDQTAETLKELQKAWKNIGPVPEKSRNDVYKRFKAACDTFFDRRRSHSRDLEGDYRDNLKKKEMICEEIENMVDKGNMDTEKFKNLQLEFDKIGYVPRNAIRKIQKRYESAVNRFIETVDLPGAEKSELKFAAEINRLKSSPNSDQKIQRKESELRRMISKLENDIALWRNNLEFFAESKKADKLREEFNKKIEEASTQLEGLKEELKVLNKID